MDALTTIIFALSIAIDSHFGMKTEVDPATLATLPPVICMVESEWQKPEDRRLFLRVIETIHYLPAPQYGPHCYASGAPI
jgi:hypothetical protein